MFSVGVGPSSTTSIRCSRIPTQLNQASLVSPGGPAYIIGREVCKDSLCMNMFGFKSLLETPKSKGKTYFVHKLTLSSNLVARLRIIYMVWWGLKFKASESVAWESPPVSPNFMHSTGGNCSINIGTIIALSLSLHFHSFNCPVFQLAKVSMISLVFTHNTTKIQPSLVKDSSQIPQCASSLCSITLSHPFHSFSFLLLLC